MTISQLKEHSLRDHGEALTLAKLRAATQTAHGALRPPRLASKAEQNPLALDGMRSCIMLFSRNWTKLWACQAGSGTYVYSTASPSLYV